jgi:hypothetical protein
MMKKFIAGFIAFVTVMLSGVCSSMQTIAVENNAEGESVQSEIVFVQTVFYPYFGDFNEQPITYDGIFVEKNGTVRSFSFQDVDKDVNLTFGTWDFDGFPETLVLDDTSPQKLLISMISDVDNFEIVGCVSEQKVNDYEAALADIDIDAEVEVIYNDEDVVKGYTETFGVAGDEIVFLNGSGGIGFNRNDEKALEIDNWLRNLDISEIPAETTAAAETTTTTTTSATTDTTTITTTTSTETTTETTATSDTKSDVPQIEFCQVQFILDYEEYYGIFLDSNRNVYSFGISDVTEDWNLYGDYSGEPIKLTDSMPQEGLLDYLYNHFDEWKLIGKTSEEDYADYKNELNQIDLNTEMVYRLFAEPDVIGRSHMERFAVRYDDGNSQIVFLCGGVDAKYDLYLENPDEHAISLNQKMIQYEEIKESATTTTTTTAETNQTTVGADETTTETNSTTTTTVVTTDETETTASTETTATTETTPTTTTTTEETTLPQTGYSKWYHVVAALAACMTGIGGALVVGSGALKKRRKID